MKLYFQHSDGVQDYLCDLDGVNDGVSKALEDLKVRAPHFKSYYQRIWQNDNDEWWVDVGDHASFYIIKLE